ncbi:MAG: hypothetical protein ACK52I_07720 [Pseudomonadota bacterium]|jgi:hypothetical protein
MTADDATLRAALLDANKSLTWQQLADAIGPNQSTLFRIARGGPISQGTRRQLTEWYLGGAVTADYYRGALAAIARMGDKLGELAREFATAPAATPAGPAPAPEDVVAAVATTRPARPRREVGGA